MKHDLNRCHADRIAFYTDSAGYYAALAEIIPRAEHQIVVVGWSFDNRTRLIRGDSGSTGADSPGDIRIGELLLDAARERPELGIHLIVWDAPTVFPADQHISPSFQDAVSSLENFTLNRLPADSAFSSRHEKYVILDNQLLFIGGMDISHNRWDTPDHAGDHSERTNPDGEYYVPYHDVQALLTGPVVDCFYRNARAEGLLDGEETDLRDDSSVSRLWPRDLQADLTNGVIEISRTRSYAADENEDIREIRKLYIRLIESAKNSIYIENQYLSDNDVTDRLIRKLEEPEGPEVIIVVPRELPDAVGKWTMGVNSAYHISVLRGHDRYGRLGVYSPLAPDNSDTPVKVHSKLMIIDGRYLTIGSANISRRSFYLDFETNILIDAADSDTSDGVQVLEDRLLSRHTGLTNDQWLSLIEKHDGSRLEAMRERARQWTGMEEAPELDESTPIPPELAARFDMDQPPPQEKVVRWITRIDPVGVIRRIRKNWIFLAVAGLIAGAVVLLSRFDVDVNQFLDDIKEINESRPVLAVFLSVFAYWISMAFLVSIVVPIVFFAALHGPWLGMVYSVAGLFSGAAVCYILGLSLHQSEWLDRYKAVGAAKRQLEKIKPYGLWAVAISRMVPSGPFMVVNIVTGLLGFTPSQFLGGSLIGLLPGIIAFSLFGDLIRDVFSDPGLTNILWFALFVGGYVALVRIVIVMIRKLTGWRREETA